MPLQFRHVIGLCVSANTLQSSRSIQSAAPTSGRRRRFICLGSRRWWRVALQKLTHRSRNRHSIYKNWTHSAIVWRLCQRNGRANDRRLSIIRINGVTGTPVYRPLSLLVLFVELSKANVETESTVVYTWYHLCPQVSRWLMSTHEYFYANVLVIILPKEAKNETSASAEYVLQKKLKHQYEKT